MGRGSVDASKNVDPVVEAIRRFSGEIAFCSGIDVGLLRVIAERFSEVLLIQNSVSPASERQPGNIRLIQEPSELADESCDCAFIALDNRTPSEAHEFACRAARIVSNSGTLALTLRSSDARNPAQLNYLESLRLERSSGIETEVDRLDLPSLLRDLKLKHLRHTHSDRDPITRDPVALDKFVSRCQQRLTSLKETCPERSNQVEILIEQIRQSGIEPTPRQLHYGRKSSDGSAAKQTSRRQNSSGHSSQSVDTLTTALLSLDSVQQRQMAPLLQLLRESGLRALVATRDARELVTSYHISWPLAERFYALIELLRREQQSPNTEFNSNSPLSIQNAIADLRSEKQEKLIGLYLSDDDRVIAVCTLALGTDSTAHLNPRFALREALLLNTPKLILAHNHPSGKSSPSADDYAMTLQFKQAAELLGIELVDHLIVGADDTASALK